jgi:hypothetical protein
MDPHPSERSNVDDGPEFVARVPIVPWTLVRVLHRDSETLRKWSSDDCVFTTKSLGDSAFALRVRGDQMEPCETGGTAIVVDPDAERRPGCLVIASSQHEGGPFLGRVAVHEGTSVLIPVDTRSPQIEMDSTVQIYGVVRQKVVECGPASGDR